MQIPKPKTIRLKGKSLAKLRIKAYVRDGGLCVDCGRWVPLDGDVFERAHMSHVKSRGSGGSDVLSNVKTKCYDCHIVKEHGPQWSQKWRTTC